MKYRFYSIFAVMAAAFVLGSCSSDDETPVTNDSRQIEVVPTIKGMTRVTTDAAGKQTFTEGDAFALWAWTGEKNNIAADCTVAGGVAQTLDAAGTWTSALPVKWKDETTPHYFFAVYPNRTITNCNADAYTLTYTEGKTAAEQEAVNDIMVAVDKSGRKAAEGKVPLSFAHIMAKLVVHLDYNSQWDVAPSTDHILTKTKTTAMIDYVTYDNPTVSATGTAVNFKIARLPETVQGFDASYSTILIPQEGFTAIGIPVGDKMFTFKNDGSMELRNGCITTVKLTVGKDKVTLKGISIAPWETGADEELQAQRPEAIVDPVAHSITLPDVQLLTPEHIDQALNGGDVLKINGYMNGTDFKVLRDKNNKGFGSVPHLTELDLSNVNIVKGGASYYNNDYYITEESMVPAYLFASFKVKKIILPANVTSINSFAFQFSMIESINIDNIISLETYAFANCKNLTSITLPEAITVIPNDAFNSCTKLNTVNIKGRITKIGKSAFMECPLETFTVPEGVTFLGESCFRKAWLKELTIASTVTQMDLNCLASIAGKGELDMNRPDVLTKLIFKAKNAPGIKKEAFLYSETNDGIGGIFIEGEDIMLTTDLSTETDFHTAVDLTIHESWKNDADPVRKAVRNADGTGQWMGIKWKTITFINDAGEIVDPQSNVK